MNQVQSNPQFPTLSKEANPVSITADPAGEQEYVKIPGFEWLFLRMPMGIYYLNRKINGKRIPKSLRTTDLSEATRKYHEILGKPIVPVGSVRVTDGVSAFWERQRTRQEESVSRYESYVRVWALPIIGDKLITEVTPADIDRVLERARTVKSQKTGKTLSKSSQEGLRCALSACFDSFTKEPTLYRYDNPVAHVERKNWQSTDSQPLDEQQILSFEEIDKLAYSFGDLFKPSLFKLSTIVRLMPRTGLRIDEALALERGSIKDGSRFGPYGSLLIVKQVRDRNPKFKIPFNPADPSTWFTSLKGRIGKIGSKMRLVPLSESAREILDAYIERGDSEGWLEKGEQAMLFKNRDNLPFVSGKVGTRISKQAAKENVLGRHIKSHWFRHTYATNAFENGATSAQVAVALGDTIKTVEDVYIHFLDRALFNETMAEASEFREDRERRERREQ
jgi:site-specific recombinase XerD